MSLSDVPIKLAITMGMNNSEQIAAQLPYSQDKQSLTLH
jgi:hypothetical protein